MFKLERGYQKFSLAKLDNAIRSVAARKSDPVLYSVFANLFFLISKFGATLYFLLDNYRLLQQAIGQEDDDHHIKKWKDSFNLTRNWFQLFGSIMKVRRTHKRL